MGQAVLWWPTSCRSSVVTSGAWVTAVARVQSLAQELLHAAGMAKKIKIIKITIPYSSKDTIKNRKVREDV